MFHMDKIIKTFSVREEWRNIIAETGVVCPSQWALLCSYFNYDFPICQSHIERIKLINEANRNTRTADGLASYNMDDGEINPKLESIDSPISFFDDCYE